MSQKMNLSWQNLGLGRLYATLLERRAKDLQKRETVRVSEVFTYCVGASINSCVITYSRESWEIHIHTLRNFLGSVDFSFPSHESVTVFFRGYAEKQFERYQKLLSFKEF